MKVSSAVFKIHQVGVPKNMFQRPCSFGQFLGTVAPSHTPQCIEDFEKIEWFNIGMKSWSTVVKHWTRCFGVPKPQSLVFLTQWIGLHPLRGGTTALPLMMLPNENSSSVSMRPPKLSWRLFWGCPYPTERTLELINIENLNSCEMVTRKE